MINYILILQWCAASQCANRGQGLINIMGYCMYTLHLTHLLIGVMHLHTRHGLIISVSCVH